jgi:hypothetical protein
VLLTTLPTEWIPVLRCRECVVDSSFGSTLRRSRRPDGKQGKQLNRGMEACTCTTLFEMDLVATYTPSISF